MNDKEEKLATYTCPCCGYKDEYEELNKICPICAATMTKEEENEEV